MQFVVEDPIPFPPTTPINHSQNTANNSNNVSNDDNSNNATHTIPTTQPPKTPPIPTQTESQSIAKIPETDQESNDTAPIHPNTLASISKPSLESALNCHTTLNNSDSNSMTDTMDTMDTNREYRVKLYELLDNGDWKDEGTGTIHFELVNNTVDIRIVSEANTDQIILCHSATNDILYDKQGDSIIQWLDDTYCNGKYVQKERAISFQTKSKCLELWRLITYIQREETRTNNNNNNHKIHKMFDFGTTQNSDNKCIDFDSDDDDDVCMNDSNGLLTTFLKDCNDEEDIDITVDESIIKTENVTVNEESKNDSNSNANAKRRTKILKKRKGRKCKKMKRNSYFSKSEKNNDSDSDNEPNIEELDSSDDEDNSDKFLQKLTMRTQKKANKNKLSIPIPTQHNLCEVYSKVKNAIENKDLQALHRLGTPQWKDALYTVFLALEHTEIHRKHSIHTPQPISPNTEKATEMNMDSNTHTQTQTDSTHTTVTPLSPVPKSEPTLTPRLSTSSLTTLPPSVEGEDNERCHPLEFIFLIVLECCRESQAIKHKTNMNNSALRNKFEAIESQQLGYLMHTSLAQLLNGSFGQSPQRNTKPLVMVWLGLDFIDKCIAMLEYDPVRRIAQQNSENTDSQCIDVSFRHRNFLSDATPTKLNIALREGRELYAQIEYVYKLNYARDCVLLGKLDLEQQSFHIINHHISKFNALICETIADDTQFIKQLFMRIKQSCSKHFGIVPSALTPTADKGGENDGFDTEQKNNSAKSLSRTVSIDDGEIEDSNDSNDSNEAATNMSLTLQTQESNGGPQLMSLDSDMKEEKNDNMDLECENDYVSERFRKCMERRLQNRKELFTAPDGVLFRFLSEYLARIKCITELQTRSSIFGELIQCGLLETLSVCVGASHVLPTKEFAHIWLVFVESIHNMISTAPCGNTAQVRTFIVHQIKTFNDYDNTSNNHNNNNGSMQMQPRSNTLLQRLCAAFAPNYICDNDGFLEQVYYVLAGILGLGDLMGMDSGANGLSYVGLGHDRDAKKKDLTIISTHFFEECVPLFYSILGRSQSYAMYNKTVKDVSPSYAQIKRMQKLVIDLLSAACEQELFIGKFKSVEEEHKLMSCIHDLIYVPKERSKTGPIPNQDLSMSCIRFLRECIHLGQHDRFWCNRMTDHGLFKNVMGLFEVNGIDTYNMLNSTILSVFASIEDKKIEEIIMYLGNEKILQKYSALLTYTSKFADLLELFDKAKHGIPIQTLIDDGSNATLSNCDSLSPRMSDSGLSPGLLAGTTGAWQNEADKQEITYFEDENETYALDMGHDSHKSEGKDQEEDDTRSSKEEEDVDITAHTPTTPNGGSKYKNGLYKDSPRPMFGTNKIRELKLPKRKKERGFDLLAHSNKGKSKKRFKVAFGAKQSEKDSSPFLEIVSAAMSVDRRVKGGKRKFEEILHEIPVTITSSYIDHKFEAKETLVNGGEGALGVVTLEPNKKKQKLMNGSSMNGHSSINESPDTFDVSEENTNTNTNNKECNGNGYHKKSLNSSILLNGDRNSKHSKDKHVHFDTNMTDNISPSNTPQPVCGTAT